MNKNKLSIIILIAGVVIALLILASGNSSKNTPEQNSASTKPNVTIENGKQTIRIDVRGGYRPLKTVAKANMQTNIDFITSSTFDCSIALRIPDLKYAKNLPTTGTTTVEIGTSTPGKLYGTCSMGMYYFEIDFQ